MPDSLDRLNERFGQAGTIRFAAGPGGLKVAEITNRHGAAKVALHGAHVLSYTPTGQKDVLWLSAKSHFADGMPIRGGIPVCWPWFGAHPVDAKLPGHGFVRLRSWTVRGTAEQPDGGTVLRLGLTSDAATLAMWPHAFDLELAVTLGSSLTVALTMRNTGSESATCTTALHTYFAVGDVTTAQVHGLDGTAYIDTVEGRNTREVQQGVVTVSEEVDRAYLDTDATCRLVTPALGRQVSIAKAGSRTTVVWNPWIAKSARMPDFGDTEYPEMICVETANARDDAVMLAAGAAHTTTTILTVKPL